jgi:hypothetical protein
MVQSVTGHHAGPKPLTVRVRTPEETTHVY